MYDQQAVCVNVSIHFVTGVYTVFVSVWMSCCYPPEDAVGSDYINKTGKQPMPRIDLWSLKYLIVTVSQQSHTYSHTEQDF